MDKTDGGGDVDAPDLKVVSINDTTDRTEVEGEEEEMPLFHLEVSFNSLECVETVGTGYTDEIMFGNPAFVGIIDSREGNDMPHLVLNLEQVSHIKVNACQEVDFIPEEEDEEYEV